MDGLVNKVRHGILLLPVSSLPKIKIVFFQRCLFFLSVCFFSYVSILEGNEKQSFLLLSLQDY